MKAPNGLNFLSAIGSKDSLFKSNDAVLCYICEEEIFNKDNLDEESKTKL